MPRLISSSPTDAERRALAASLAAGAAPRARVVGSSMRPTLRDGDELELRGGEPAPGEVLAVAHDGRLVVHRLVRRERERLILRGDANLREDPPVPPEALLGRVTAAWRAGEPLPLGVPPNRLASLRTRALLRLETAEVRVASGLIRLPHRLRSALVAATEAAVLGTFDAARLDLLTANSYSRSSYAEPEFLASGLQPWEEETLAQYFPPKGRWLVTSAGGGRQVLALLAQGVEVTATECEPGLAAALMGVTSGRADVLRLPPDELPPGRFEAAVLGWGSYSHLTTRARRIGLLRRLCQQLVPGGPVLVSYLARASRPPTRRGRAVLAAATTLARITGVEPPELGASVETGKFIRRFAPGEVPAELEAAGWSVRLESTMGYAHTVGVAPATGG